MNALSIFIEVVIFSIAIMFVCGGICTHINAIAILPKKLRLSICLYYINFQCSFSFVLPSCHIYKCMFSISLLFLIQRGCPSVYLFYNNDNRNNL